MAQNSTGTDNPERELVKRILSGSNSAFGELIKNTQRLVFSITLRMLNNPSDNDDICQDIFIKAYTNISKFKFDSKLSTWIARIAYTTCVNHIQKKKTGLLDDMIIRDEEEDESFSNRIKDDSTEMPDESLFIKELKSRLAEEINLLPPLLKTIIGLYHQEEMSYVEIVEVTGLPVGTVKSYLFRGRKLLKEKLTKKFKQEHLL
jgi:RNA polymerase sigma factor (sigma-70 family)